MKFHKIFAVCLSMLLLFSSGCRAPGGGKTVSSNVSSAAAGSTSSASQESSSSSASGALSSTKNAASGRPGLSASGSASSRKAQSSSDEEPQIMDQVSDSFKARYKDMTLTNEWIGPEFGYGRRIVLFGALKENPKQGAAQIIRTDKNGAVKEEEMRILSPKKKGAIRVARLGTIDGDMDISYPDGETQHFSIYWDFCEPSNPNADPQIISRVSDSLKTKHKDIIVTNEWIGPELSYGRHIVLFGALKKDPKQGVAEIIRFDRSDAVKEEIRCLSPKRKGAIWVYRLGAKGDDMDVIYPDGEKQYFSVYGKFDVP